MDKRIRRLVSYFLYAAAVIQDNGEGLWKGLRGRTRRRIAAWICSLCLVVNLLPMTAFAAGTGTSSDTSNVYEYVHNEEGGNIEEKTPTEQPTEDLTEKPAEAPTETPTEKPTEESTEKPTETPAERPTEEPTETPSEDSTEQPTQDSTEKPTEDSTENPTEQPTEDSTEQPTETPTEGPVEHPTEDSIEKPVETPTEEPVEKPTETPLEKEENFTGTCICDILCEEGIINLDCEVCSAEGADLSVVCEGREHEEINCICDPVVTRNGVHTNPDCPLYVEPEITAYKQVVALFKALPSADSITEDTTEEERDILRVQIDEAIDALYALSDEDFAKFTAEHEALLAALKALREAVEETVPNLLAGSVVEVLHGDASKGSYSTLPAAITAASNGDTLKILDNINLGTSSPGVTITDKSLPLDLNDQTITHKGMYGAIKLTGSADLTVTDSGANGAGKLEEGGSGVYLFCAIYSENTSNVTVSGGTVSAAGQNGAAIVCADGSSASIVVDGGIVSATSGTGTAIYNIGNGSVVVKGGKVSTSAASVNSNSAISSVKGGSIEVSGGMVSGEGVPAIRTSIKPITVTIKDGAKVTSACTDVDIGTIVVQMKGSVLNIEGGMVENTADSGNVIRNGDATVNISGGTVSASGSGTVVNNASDVSAVNISGGIVSATNGCAIYNNAEGTIIISENATITSANSQTDNTDSAGTGTIFIKKVADSIETAKVYLDIQGSAIVKNTANPEGYSVYFNDAKVTSENLSQYYKKAENATVGKVHPEPSVVTKPVPTASGNDIYANGVDIRIVAGLTDGNPNSNTNILYDKNGDGQIEDDEYLQVGADAPSASGYPSINNIYGVGGNITMEGGIVQVIYGGSDSQYEGDTNITMTGGKADNVFGGGNGSDGSVKGNTNIAISGGTVGMLVYGGGNAASVDGTTTITITGGTVNHSVYGGSRNASVNGAKTVTIGASAKIGNNNTGGIVIDGGTSNITNGVTSFVIGDDLTGADESILVSLPAGYAGGIIATEAVSSDLAKLKLVGSGATGKKAHLDGTEIKVGAEGVAPTVDESQKRIYANGAEIKIVAGTTTGYTNILYDKNGNNQIEDDEYLQIGTTAPGAEGYALSQYKVYGGSSEADLTVSPKITITGGVVDRIYGGCYGTDLTGSPKITVEGGKVNSIYGGGNVGGSDDKGVVNGNTEVIISGGETGWVYGGGDGSYDGGKVNGNTEVTISNTGKVTSSVYGGSYGTNVDGSTKVTVGVGGSVGGNVYGGSGNKGGRGGVVNQNTVVIIENGGTVEGDLYGGGNSEYNTVGSTVIGTATVDIRGGTIKGAVYGGGRKIYAPATVGSSTVAISGGAKIGSVDKTNSGIIINGGTGSITNGVASFAIGDDLTGAAESIFVNLPAGYAGGTIATEAVSGDLAKIKLAGDGAAGKEAYLNGTEIKVREKGATPTVSSYSIYANGAEIKIVAGTTTGYTNILYDKNGDGQIEDTEYLWISEEPGPAGYDLKQYTVYGGSKNTALTANPKITMTGGRVTSIYGGSNNSVVTGDTSVTVSGGEASSLCGGGSGSNSNVTGSTAVTISDGKVTFVYGGGSGIDNKVSRNTSVTMSGGKVVSVNGGGNGGKVEGSVSVDISGGETNTVYGGSTGGIVTGASTVVISGGTVSYKVYGGGLVSTDTVGEGSTVTIGGGVNIGNPDNSDSGIVINGGTDNIANGVTSFVIGNNLTGAAGSIFVSLPAGYTGGIIATEAVSGDLAKIKLAGDGAVGKEAYLDGTEIKVRQSGVDKTDLAEAIAAANSAKNGITVSNNPASSVADGTKFVTTAEMKALTDAIAAAKIVMDNSLATAGEVAAAADALNSAVTTFKAAIKTGTDTGSGGGTSDGGSLGGGSSGGGSSNDSGTKTPSATTEPGALTESEINMEGTVDASGNVTVTLPEQHVEDAIKKAEEEARKSGNPAKGITLVLNVNTGSNTAGSVTVNLPKVTQETIISKEIANTMIVVNHPEIQISLDLSAVQEINRQANADVNITSTRQDNNRLTGNAKAVIGSRPVFDLKVNYGSGKEVTYFGAGSVSVAIPYTLGAGEVAGGVYAVYVDGSGNVQWMDSSLYDAENRLLRFNTSHFSIYGIGYKAPAAFTDTQGHWAKDDIQFVVDRGLMNGASATAFDPDGAVTRGMFVATLGRLAGADVSGYATSSFTDVGADAYYMGYVEWAVEKGIVGGTSATTFAPDDAVTREQMAVMMANYARAAGISLPKVHTENTFADGADISEGAREAVKAMQMAGVLAGRDGNRFDPQGTATRAQAAAALRRFIEVTIDASTAQGWRQNDDGQWMYYENGTPVKHTTKQVDGENYSFNAFGVTLDYPKKKTRTGTYTVQAGDSFWLIAKKHNVDMYMLAAVNGKTIHSIIHPGDVLMIPQ
ncbi:MAG: S-layer homology domain-containing protein [Enterocloster asparagiformis]|nr:S-layer homology domain-containing protein [Enterocloster asparagiformis]